MKKQAEHIRDLFERWLGPDYPVSVVWPIKDGYGFVARFKARCVRVNLTPVAIALEHDTEAPTRYARLDPTEPELEDRLREILKDFGYRLQPTGTLVVRMIAHLQAAERELDGPKQPADGIIPDSQVQELGRLMRKFAAYRDLCCEGNTDPGGRESAARERRRGGRMS
jgi:hypothetical protein